LAAAIQLCSPGGVARADGDASQPRQPGFRTVQAETPRDTEVNLRKIISELAQAAPDYAGLEPPLQQAIRQQVQAAAGLLKRLGPLQGVEYIGLQKDADVYRVTFEHGTTSWTIAMSPSGKIATLFFRPLPDAERTGEEITVAGLSGTLLKPDNVKRPPVVLLIAGSGPTDRNGNQNGAGPGELRQLAEALAERGIASLRYDKRGIGRSAATNLREEDFTFGTLVADAGMWVGLLRQREDLGPLFVLGHSEGGVVAIELAKASSLAGLILLATPGRRFGDVLREQLQAAGLSVSLRDQALAILAALERGEDVATVDPALMSLFRPSVQPFLRSELAVDPAADLHATVLPVLIVSGGHDIQVSATDAALLTAARPDARRLHVNEMNHALKITPAGRAVSRVPIPIRTSRSRPTWLPRSFHSWMSSCMVERHDGLNRI
jgi:pimeloyl-ACP methyl ester carboxylesterase